MGMKPLNSSSVRLFSHIVLQTSSHDAAASGCGEARSSDASQLEPGDWREQSRCGRDCRRARGGLTSHAPRCRRALPVIH
eukprot:455509-Rhodomonas_salina.1